MRFGIPGVWVSLEILSSVRARSLRGTPASPRSLMRWLLCVLTTIVVTAGAGAQTDPPGCTQAVVSVQLTALVNGVPVSSVVPGQLVQYRVQLSVPSPNGCNIVGGQLAMRFPNNMLVHVAGYGNTPMPNIPLFGFAVPLVIDVPMLYTVSGGDAQGGLLTARVAYGTVPGSMIGGQQNGMAQTNPPTPVTALALLSLQLGAPNINLHMNAVPSTGCEGQPMSVTFIYEVSVGTGNQPLTNVHIDDPNCQNAMLVSGDANGNGILDIDEVWIFQCKRVLSTTTLETATAEGQTLPPNSVIVQDSDDRIVEFRTPPIVDLDVASDVVCVGSDVHLTATVTGGRPPYTVVWEVPGGPGASCAGIPAGGVCIFATLALPGQYCAVVTDTNGCSTTVCVNIDVVSPPTCTIQPQQPPVCDSNGNVAFATVIGGSGNYTYNWSIISFGGWFINGPPNAPVLHYHAGPPGSSATLRLTVVDQVTLCTTQCQVLVMCNAVSNPEIQIFKHGDPSHICAGVPTPVMYFYDVRIPFGGVPLTNVHVTDDRCGPVTFVNGDNDNDGILDDGEIWLYQCTQVISSTTTNVATAIGQTLSQPPFLAIATVAFTVLADRPSIAVDPASIDACVGETVTLVGMVDGGRYPYTVVWRRPNGSVALTCSVAGPGPICPLTVPIVSAADGGPFCVEIVDQNGCGNTACATVNVSGSECTITPNGASICAGQFANFTANPVGGAGPFTFAWTGPGGFVANTPSIIVNTPGSYTVIIVDATGCTSTCTATLIVSAPPTCFVSPATATTCPGQPAAMFTATPGLGSPPYTYHWTGPAGFMALSQSVSVTVPGVYEVTVTDAHGCQTMCQATLTLSPTCPPPGCAGDLNGDGNVNIDDLVIVINNWGTSGGPNGIADVNHNGIVDIDDLVFVIRHWGLCPPPCPFPFVCNQTVVYPCNEEGLPCFCATAFGGGSSCVQKAPCADLQLCYIGECPPGFVCVTQTCCGPNPVCLPICGNPALSGTPIPAGTLTPFGIEQPDGTTTPPK